MRGYFLLILTLVLILGGCAQEQEIGTVSEEKSKLSPKFINIEGIEGESMDDVHQNWIEVLSFNHSISRPQSQTRRTEDASKEITTGEFSIVKEVDSTSPKLRNYASSGETIPKVTFEVYDTEKEHWITYTLEEAVIDSYKPMSSTSDSQHLEKITFTYQSIKWESSSASSGNWSDPE